MHTTSTTWKFFARANNNLSYASTGDTNITVLNGAYGAEAPLSVSNYFTAVQGLAWDNGNSFLWVIGENGASRRIAAFNTIGVLQTGPFTLTTRAYSYLAYDGNSLWSVTVNSGTQYTAWKVSTTDGQDITNFIFDLPHNLAGLCWDNSFNMIWARAGVGSSNMDALYAFDTSGNQQAVPISVDSATTLASDDYAADTGDFDIIDSSQFVVPGRYSFANSGNPSRLYYYRIYHIRANGLGSRAKLSEPVIKTNTQTLKAIYTINFV